MRIKSAPSAAQPYPRYAACANIREFGAVGNGTADDAVALRSAINNVGSGCSIFFPPGVYKLASNITINKDITLQLGPQVEIRQFSRLLADTNAVRSLTVQGEGPGTSVWRQAIDFPFWSGVDNGPRFKNLRLINLEFSPYLSTLDFPHHYGGSTDLFEMTSVTISRGNCDPFRVFRVRTGDIALTTAALNVLRDIVVSGTHIGLEVLNADLQITRLTGNDIGTASISLYRSSGSGQLLVSSCRLNIGFTGKSAVSPIVEVGASGSGTRIAATINDLEIVTESWDAAIDAYATFGAEINLLANAIRFTTTYYGAGYGYAIKTQDDASSIMRAVISASFLRTTTPRSDAAIQGTLANASSLRTLAGVDQRGWASLT
jgi:hypothetical protein